MFTLINTETQKAYSSQTAGNNDANDGFAWVDIDSGLADTTTTDGTLLALADWLVRKGQYPAGVLAVIDTAPTLIEEEM